MLRACNRETYGLNNAETKLRLIMKPLVAAAVAVSITTTNVAVSDIKMDTHLTSLYVPLVSPPGPALDNWRSCSLC